MHTCTKETHTDKQGVVAMINHNQNMKSRREWYVITYVNKYSINGDYYSCVCEDATVEYSFEVFVCLCVCMYMVCAWVRVCACVLAQELKKA